MEPAPRASFETSLIAILTFREHPMLNINLHQLANPQTFVGVVLGAYALLFIGQVAAQVA